MTGSKVPSDIVSESDVALIGLSGRFPGAEDVDAFWRNLGDGIESISNFADDELAAGGVDPALFRDPNYVRASGVISGHDQFDAFFFGYSPGEAETMDPQHRLFLEHAWQALENAGYNPDTYAGLIGVYAGASMNTYLYNNLRSHQGLMAQGGGYHVMVASDKDFLATKASYKLNLKGPSVTVQTACSTSLVAVHMACQSLRNGECDMALAGGVSVRVPHRAGYLYQDGIVLSPDGHCRAFDAQASGTVIGSGVGIVVLKMLADAIDDGDRILAVVKGSAINNDGSLKAGYTAPSLDAQAAVIVEAQGVAGVEADSVTYIEAHGTGTAIGDPIEVAALTKAFRFNTERRGFCGIGSVKTNIGHLDAAAGVAGLIKTVLAIRHSQIPPSLNFEEPNPRIDFAGSPFYVNTVLSKWETDGAPRRAGVSSFGIGGTNAHVVLEEAPALESSGPSRSRQLLLLSARTESALEEMTANLAAYLRQHPDLDLADVAYTLQVGRKRFECRRALVCRDVEEAAIALDDPDPARVLTTVEEASGRPVVFMFTGQGGQYVNMGLELYRSEPIFRQTIDRCCDVLEPHLGRDLRDILYPPEGRVEEATEQLNQTALAQPALFVIEYALARLWQSWGVSPRAMIGHSIGEYVAACLAGVFSLEDGLALVAARGELMQGLPEGAMLAVSLPEEDVRPFLGEGVSLGVINAPSACVVSGRPEAVEALQVQLEQAGATCRRLHTSHAFHSPMMDPILEAFADRVGQVVLHPPRMPYISNVTGTWITAEQVLEPTYWVQHLRRTVRFSEGVERLMEDAEQILLEVGPGRTLRTLATRHTAKSAEQIVLSSLRHPRDRGSDLAFVLDTLGRLWLAGATVGWDGFYANERRQRLALPTYPFERQRYWLEPGRRGRRRVEPSADSRKSDVADWFYLPSWRRADIPMRDLGTLDPSYWLVFTDECGVGSELVARLEQAGHGVVEVRTGEMFEKRHAGAYTLCPSRSDDYDALLADLRAREAFPRTIVYLWAVTSDGRVEPPEWARTLGFDGLLYLAQALGRQNVTDDVTIFAFSTDIQEVNGDEAICPEKALLLGPVHIIPHEYPNVSCRSIDVRWSQAADVSGLVDRLLTEVMTDSPEQVVAYRGPHRWGQAFEPVRLEAARDTALPYKEKGVYLITGGLGGVGSVLAKHLVERAQARLVLLTRSLSPGHQERVRELETLGAEVLVIGTDVTDRERLQAAVDQAVARFGQIDGVIHAAGVPGAGLIQLKTQEVVERVLAPKVRGTLVLADVLKDQPLDFFVLCSSINSVVGRLGQVDYCAANAFLDAFGHYAPALPVICINWETWQEVGMAARMATTEAGRGAPSRAADHPLLDRCVFENEDRVVYATDFAVRGHWVLHEHGILGSPMLPGTAYLEMAQAAFEAHVGDGVAEMRDVYFLTPLIVEGEEVREARTVLQKEGDGFTFSVTSRTGDGWQEHARGRIVSLQAETPMRQTLDEIKVRCSKQEIDSPLERARLGSFDLRRQVVSRGLPLKGRPLSVDSIVIAEASGGAQARSMEFGPRWQGLKWVGLGEREGLALLELPRAFEDDLESYRLHPALLDFATSFLRLFESEGSYLPLSYRQLQVMRPLPGRVYSHVRLSDSGSERQGMTLGFDVTLFDEEGRALVEVKEFTVMRLDDVGKLSSLSGASALLPDDPTVHTHAGLLEGDLAMGLLSAEGVDVFDRILASGLRRVIVSTRDLYTRIEKSRASSAALMGGATGDDGVKPKHPRPKLMTPYAAPRSEMEQKLAEIWQEVLGVEQVGVHDNFFDLGGDSLLIAQVHTRFRQSFEFDLSAANLLQYPTIADLTQHLAELSSVEHAPIELVQERVERQKAALKRRRQSLRKKKVA